MSQFFASSLRRASCCQVLGFGGEADQQPVALLAAEFGQDIRRRIEFQRKARRRLLHLLLRHARQMEIGHRRGLDHDRRPAPGSRRPRRASPARCARGITRDPTRRRQVHRAGDQDHARAASDRSLGQRVAHLAARPIGDEAHRIERLLRGAGGDQHRLAFQVPPAMEFCFAPPRRSAADPPAVPGRPCRRPDTPSSGSTIR